MQPRNTTLYDKLRWGIEDACKDSSSWQPHGPKYRNLVESIVGEDIVQRNIRWWKPNTPATDEAAMWLTRFFDGYQEETRNDLAWSIEAFEVVYSRLEEFLYQ